MRRTAPAVAALSLLALAGSFSTTARAATATGAVDDPGLGAFQLDAHAAAFQYTYASPGLLATGDVIFGVTIPESTATLSGGPFGRALSSIAWPGPVLADLGVIVEQSTAEDQRPPFRIPSYPVRAEAFNPQGPAEAEAEPVPGARMHALSDGYLSRADGRLTGASIAGLVSLGGVTSDARSFVEGGVGVTEAVAHLTDVSLLAGLVRFDAITSTLRTTSDGEAATSEARTQVAGFRFAGVDAVVDRDGIHLAAADAGGTDATRLLTDRLPAGEITAGLRNATDPASGGLATLLEGVDGGLNELARQSGISIRLLDTEQRTDGALGQAAAGGLLIELFYDGMTTPLFSDLLALVPYQHLPAEYPKELSAIPFTPQALALLARETHINTFTFGAAATQVAATPPFDFDFSLPDFSGTDGYGSFGSTGDGSIGFGGTPAVLDTFAGGGDLTGGAGGGSGGLAPAVGSAPRVTPQALPIAAGQAVPGALAVGIVVAAPLFSRWSRRLARHTLEPRT